MYNRDTKALLWGRISTNIADSLQYMIIMWFFNERFQSPFLLGLIFAVESGADVLSFLFGPLIDNSNSKKLLVNCSLVQIINVMVLTVLSLTIGIEANNFWAIIMVISMSITTLASTILYPLQMKMIPMVAKDVPLVKVNGLFHVSEKVFDILFNAIATILIAKLLIPINLIITLVVFFVAVKLYSLINYDQHFNFEECEDYEEEGTISEYLEDLKEGFVELKNQGELLKLIVPLIFVNFFYAIAMVGLPRFSTEFISDEATGYGILLTFSAIGSILGASLSQIKNIEKISMKKMVSFCLMMAGISWLLIPTLAERFIYASYIGIFLNGIFISYMNIIFISLVQSRVSEDTLGRVATINESILSSIIPIGNFVGAWILKELGVITTQYTFAIALILFGLYYIFIRS